MCRALSPVVARSAVSFEWFVNIEWGAFFFGTVIGWFTYFVNRYRTNVALGDVATVIGAVGGGAVLALFPEGTALFGAYGVGLAFGFFGYFLVLLRIARGSEERKSELFLEGQPGNRGMEESAEKLP
jgi:hypothetical protein